ncbi:phytanoyl-CoA dioxygenase family protein [Sphingomonas sp. KR1UV-12]|uniref:Phytanoyl-CoA dioxygenase family protein n=1 Tax=Sphingomonas aurea TaxID=3063994 RepID=A0ABT9EHF2_9SPHN|nr:phytanoyl-CoA dioxygenase family protein [Sphingomonas sp. KR1UV-12]MDP1026206.1 phytanoyl-CoA dioxygenase family protein [Sphingomonas sp. KR1UV-12]
MDMALDTAGFARCPFRLSPAALGEVCELFAAMGSVQPGMRIDPRPLREMAALVPVQSAAATRLGVDARPVRALLFDKHDGANWSLGWHQDRTIEVAAQVRVAGFGPFTRKQGRLHVAPPVGIIERMLTVRVHVDAVDDDNGPLIVAPGSHRLGYIAEASIASVVDRCGETACVADTGDVWFYATPILHRSGRAIAGRRRRVLQVDYAHDPLPGGLAWAADA